MMMLRMMRNLRITHKATENRDYESSMQDRRAPTGRGTQTQKQTMILNILLILCNHLYDYKVMSLLGL